MEREKCFKCVNTFPSSVHFFLLSINWKSGLKYLTLIRSAKEFNHFRKCPTYELCSSVTSFWQKWVGCSQESSSPPFISDSSIDTKYVFPWRDEFWENHRNAGEALNYSKKLLILEKIVRIFRDAGIAGTQPGWNMETGVSGGSSLPLIVT